MRRWLNYLFLLLLGVVGSPLWAATLHVGFAKLTGTDIVMPGTGGAKFQQFGVPAFGQGVVVFNANSGMFHRGIFSNLPGYIQLVADNQTGVPTLNASAGSNLLSSQPVFNQFLAGDASILPMVVNNEILFFGGSGESRRGLYTFANQSLNLIVDTNTKIPGVQDNFSNFLYPFLFKTGSIIFISRDQENYGVFQADPNGKLSILFNANSTKIVKGHGKFIKINELISSSENKDSEYVFIGEGEKNQIGIYKVKDRVISKVADKNTKVPDALGFFSSFHDVGMNGDQVAFEATGILGQEGVYVSTSAGIQKVADIQDTFLGTQNLFAHFNQLTFHQGILIFHATTNAGDDGLFLYTLKQGLFKVLACGDKINGKEVNGIKLGRFSLDGNNVALRLHFKDHSEGIYVATLAIGAY